MTSLVWVQSLADLPTPWQMLFQDPLTSMMEGLVDLHHDICFFLITILILVVWLGLRIITSFHHTRMPVPEKFNHLTTLELCWAILPSVIVTMIALPSLTLIYTFDDLILKPALTVKVVGKQWYWGYELSDEILHSNLYDVDRLLEL